MSNGNYKAYLLLGGNLGDVENNFLQAENLLPEEIKVLRKSEILKTAPWRMENAPDFLNQAWEISTGLYPHQLLHALLVIEEKLGRKRSSVARGYESRTIDIDILFYEDLVINDEELKVPHPRFSERLFAVLPMCELSPNFIHPIEQRSVEEIYALLLEKTHEVQL